MRPAAHGVALPITLILLAVLTGLVLTQVRRGTIDERLAGNSRQSVMLDNAAITLLRWCEMRVIARPLQTVTVPAGVGRAAWRDPDNWAPDRTFTFPEFTVPGVTYNRCLIEEASAELEQVSPSAGQGNEIDQLNYRKYRITAQVRTPDASMPGGVRAYFLQSEIRLYL